MQRVQKSHDPFSVLTHQRAAVPFLSYLQHVHVVFADCDSLMTLAGLLNDSN